MQQRPVGTDGLVSMWESEVGGCIMAYSVPVNQHTSNWSRWVMTLHGQMNGSKNWTRSQQAI